MKTVLTAVSQQWACVTGGGGCTFGHCALHEDVSAAFSAPAKANGGSCIPHSEREILHLTSMVTDATPVSRRAFGGDGVLNAHEVMCRQAVG